MIVVIVAVTVVVVVNVMDGQNERNLWLFVLTYILLLSFPTTFYYMMEGSRTSAAHV